MSVPCRLCRSNNCVVAHGVQSPHLEREFSLYTCPDCGSAFFDASQHDIDLEQFYSDIAVVRSSVYDVPFQPSPYWRSETARITRLARRPVRSVLDIGCRTGDFLLHWPGDMRREGVELAEHSARVARSRGLTVHQEYLEKIEFAEPFDVVSCYAVMEHLPEPSPVLARMSELIQPGGILVVMIPTRECVKRVALDMLGKRWHMYSPPEHLNFMSRKFLDRTLAQYGFTLAQRRFTAGGMFNPLGLVPLARKVGPIVMEIYDRSIPLNRLPLFDHLYNYYRRRAA